MHLVHQDATGQLEVLNLLIKEGKPNAALETMFARLPSKPEESYLMASFDPLHLFPSSLAHFSFEGLLTTPPCSEGVTWRVTKSLIEMFG